MTADQLMQRDARIAELEARGPLRTIDEQDELVFLESNRDQAWRKLPERARRARQRANELEAYARQIGLPLERGPAR